jgi:hypothetical protein
MLLTTVSLAPIWGCGEGSEGAAPVSTLPVKGTVTYRGKRLARGTIKFEPEGLGREAYGTIKSDGTFVLTTYKADDGAVPGSHRVAVLEADKGVPLKYASYGGSQLQVEVTPGKTEYPIELQ